MCGIAGVIDGQLSPEARRARVERMCQAMFHRGPDSAGAITSSAATLGTRRLAIFDPALGDQPMTSADGRYVLVFNGAIYNFRELRRELENGGAVFRTQCDTEVLLAAWTKWGAACLPRLRGMFAFAVWDARFETLSLARDRFGIKPLYFARRGQRFAFASELGALTAGLGESLTIDPVSISHYLGWLAVPAPRTIFQDVCSLQPGETATFAAGRIEIARWSQRASGPAETPICATREEFTRELRARLEDSIRAHCLADVSVGAFLSGGLDSSSIVALMSRQAGAQLKTFSIGFEERDWDESDHADEIARHFGTTHEKKRVTGRELAHELPRMLAAMDQPTGDGINTYLASELARAGGVKVALSGLGADELFGGYPSFQQVPAIARWISRWQKVPAAARRVVLQQLRARGTGSRKLADILEHGGNVHEICALQRRVFSSHQVAELLDPALGDHQINSGWHHPSLSRLAGAYTSNETDVRTIVSQWESETYMADVLLRDSDMMSMRHSLELRVPFVDQPLVDWVTRQKPEFRFDSTRPKSALFEALRDVLPVSLEHRRKRGFTLPFAQWMRQELRPFLEETFSDSSVRRSGFFSAPAMQSLWRSYLQGSDTRQWSRVWSLAVLVQFANRFSPPVGTLRGPVGGTAPSAPVDPRGADGAAPSTRECRSPARESPSTVVLLAPELFAREGGIARMLRVYLRALVEIAGGSARVRFVSLNDSPQDGCGAGFTPAVHGEANGGHKARPTTISPKAVSPVVWRACGGDKARFVQATLQLARSSDLLICGHVAQLPVAFAAKVANPRLRILLVAHGIEVWRPFTVAEQLALQATDRILCVSEFTRDEMCRWISLPRSQFAILPNALDPELAFAAPPTPRGAPVILSISRLDSGDRYKGIDHLLRAMPAIRARVPGATLRIIGRGDDLPRLQTLRAELALGDAVEFLGYRDDKSVADELSRCAVFALPSTREGFGLVFLEAMAAGRPCVGVRSGAVPELIAPNAGILVEPDNVPALAHACVDALERTWDHSSIIARAQEFSYPIFKERLSTLIHPAFPGTRALPLETHP